MNAMYVCVCGCVCLIVCKLEKEDIDSCLCRVQVHILRGFCVITCDG